MQGLNGFAIDMQNRFREQGPDTCGFWRTGHSMCQSSLKHQGSTLSPADGGKGQFAIGHHSVQLHRDHVALVFHIGFFRAELHSPIQSPCHIALLLTPYLFKARPTQSSSENLARMIHLPANPHCLQCSPDIYLMPFKVVRASHTICFN